MSCSADLHVKLCDMNACDSRSIKEESSAIKHVKHADRLSSDPSMIAFLIL